MWVLICLLTGQQPIQFFAYELEKVEDGSLLPMSETFQRLPAPGFSLAGRAIEE